MLLAVMALCLACLLVWLAFTLHTIDSAHLHSTIIRMIASTSIGAFAMVAHCIISVILLATEYNNYAFGLVMLYVTELIPITLIIALLSYTRASSIASAASGMVSNGRGSSKSGTRPDATTPPHSS
jgi:hypothetical protein